MSFKDKMNELQFVERRMALNKDYFQDFFTFNKKSALNALSYLIENATKSIEIYHKPLAENDDNFQTNQVLSSLRNNSTAKISYYTSFDKKDKVSKEDNVKLIKKYIGKNTEIVDLDVGDNVLYHHKEMVIDNKYLIITSMNFLTNSVTTETIKNVFWLENFSIWVKRSGK